MKDRYSTAHSGATDVFIPSSIQHNTAALIRASLSTASWNKHISALNCFHEFESSKDLSCTWPLSENVVCDFVAYAILNRKLKSTTVKSYLSSLAFYHKLRNWESSACSNFLVCSMLKGAKNIELYTDITKQTRKAMTYPLLKVLSHQIAITSWPVIDKQILWTLFTVAFFGSFRFGEIVSRAVHDFNEQEDLLWSDVTFGQDFVTFRIKITKNKTPTGEFVDLFLQEGCKYCPVQAIKKLKGMVSPVNENTPVFKLSDGSYLTTKRVNDILFSLFNPLLGDEAALITGHSFRAALPSVLANCPDIASQEEIRLWGRWSSSSYLLYTRLKTRQKRLIFEKIVSSLSYCS
jgi:hypothetical protein